MLFKKLLKKINLRSSFVFFAAFFFTSLFLVFPNTAFAGVKEWVAFYIPIEILSFLIMATKAFAWIAGGFLDKATSGSLIGWGYTNNTVVNLGLGITKQFVNLGIVTVLVFVSLLITLNYKAYDGKKILVKLILIALLVNFAPVLVGLIVDATNITMNYFLIGIKDGVSGILNNSTSSSESITKGLEDVNSWTQGYSLISQGCAAIVLNIGIAFAFVILFCVFMFRYIMIWLLTILSPLAFVAWILPNTKKFWDLWWNQLIQWSIIGIPMAFFLYLAMASYQAIATSYTAKIGLPGFDTGTSAWFSQTFPYVLVLVMLYLGFILGLKTSAMGATSIINFASSKQKAIAGLGWKGFKAGGRRVYGTFREKMAQSEGAQNIGNRLATAKRWGGDQKGIIGGLKRTVSAIPYHLSRSVGNALAPKQIEDQKTKISKGEELAKGKEDATILSEYNNAAKLGNRAIQIGIINQAIKENKLGDIMDKNKFGENAVSQKQLNSLYKDAKKLGSDQARTIKKATPEIAANSEVLEEMEKAGISLSNKTQYSLKMIKKLNDIIKSLKPEEYKNISRESLKDTRVINALIENATAKGINSLLDVHGKEVIEQIEKTLKTKAGFLSKKSGVKVSAGEYLERKNKRLYEYLAKGQGSGLIDLE